MFIYHKHSIIIMRSIVRSPKKSLLDESFIWGGLGTLLTSGTPILQALNTIGSVFPAYNLEISEIGASIKEGETFYEPLIKRASSFHVLMPTLVDIGEQTGALPEVLLKGGDVIRKDLTYSVNSQIKIAYPDLERLAFFNYLATLVDAGAPVVRSLEVLSKAPSLARIGKDLGAIQAEIKSGKTLSESAAKYNYFNPFDIAMIKAGELGGVLEVNLRRLADYTERKYFSSKSKK